LARAVDIEEGADDLDDVAAADIEELAAVATKNSKFRNIITNYAKRVKKDIQ
jgi:hypothetical protein